MYNIKKDTVFMNWENRKTSRTHVLILNLTDRIDLGRVEKTLPYQILVFITHGKINITIINLKYLLQHRMKNLNYQMDHT